MSERHKATEALAFRGFVFATCFVVYGAWFSVSSMVLVDEISAISRYDVLTPEQVQFNSMLLRSNGIPYAMYTNEYNSQQAHDLLFRQQILGAKQ